MCPGIGSAPGKVIISGEHSVVYGYPAIAGSIGLRCNVEATTIAEGIKIEASDINLNLHYLEEEISALINGKTVNSKLDNIAYSALEATPDINPGISVKISSKIPISAGLGSSAAVAIATVAAIADLYDMKISKTKISKIAFNAEKITHGTPSGIDNSVITHGGLLKFEKGEIIRKKLNHPIPLVIGNTNVPRDTKHLVQMVANLKKNNPIIINDILHSMGKITNQVDVAIENHQLKQLGILFEINHGLLEAIGVGHSSISSMIWKIKNAGVLGAKLTGAGGGGCVIALTRDKEHREEIIEKLNKENIDIIPTELSPVGVIIGSATNE